MSKILNRNQQTLRKEKLLKSKLCILFFLFFIPLLASASPNDSINYYDKALMFLIDSIIPKEEKKIVIYFNGETTDQPAAISIMCCIDLLNPEKSPYDSLSIGEAYNEEKSGDFWQLHTKDKIKVEIKSPIKKGKIRGFNVKIKRNMRMSQIREIKELKQINIYLATKNEIRGESFCIIFNKDGRVVKWCKSGWIR
jgi:hypothetical protein